MYKIERFLLGRGIRVPNGILAITSRSQGKDRVEALTLLGGNERLKKIREAHEAQEFQAYAQTLEALQKAGFQREEAMRILCTRITHSPNWLTYLSQVQIKRSN